MRRLLIVMLSALGLLAACGDDAAMTPEPGARILALGDSYTIGEGVDSDERWPIQLAELLRAEGVATSEPKIIARTGWTTDELSEAIEQAEPAQDYDLVSLLIGVNNQYRGRPQPEYQEQFRDLLQTAIGFAGGDASRVVVLSIPDWGVTPFAKGLGRESIAREIDAFNLINRRETETAGARYIDVTGVSRRASEEADLIAGDGLHPSARMYHEWADLVFPEALAALTTTSP